MSNLGIWIAITICLINSCLCVSAVVNNEDPAIVTRTPEDKLKEPSSKTPKNSVPKFSFIQSRSLQQNYLLSQIIAKNRQIVTNRTINIHENDIIIYGKPFHIISGSLHYFRVPAAYWRDRLRKMKAAGLNAVSTYVEWSFHEPEERQYNFEGDRNIAEFIKIAAEEDLYVLLRPGPYICAERDLGGFPYWLLGKYPQIRLRSTDNNFIQETEIWMNKLFEQLKPLLFTNGGPIIMVQVENEYGSYGNDTDYKKKIRDIISKHVKRSAILYTTDGMWRSYFTAGAVPGALTTIDFGPTSWDIYKMFSDLRTFMPIGPLMNSEYYTGWITHWGEPLSQKSSSDVVQTLVNMLNNTIHVNFYMFFGGTNFEYSAGANYDGTYQPDITSYDYDSPLSEAGDPTPKYYDIRNAIMNFKQEVFDAPPQPAPKGSYGNVVVRPRFNIMSPEGRAALGRSYNDVTGSILPTFESLRQRSGLMLYETTLEEGMGLLIIQKPRDLIYVYVDGVLIGKISRGQKLFSLPIISNSNSILSLLVENQGRINFGPLIHDRKGILSELKYGKTVLNGTWKITGYPLEKMEFTGSPNENAPTVTRGAVLYAGQFTLPADQPTLDTFLDTSGWGKGYIWINGYNLGRYWPSMGPQVTLYVPGVWLKPAPKQNHLLILELEDPSQDMTLKFIDYPILNRTKQYQLNDL